MPGPSPLTPDKLERLMADLDAGVYDEELRASRGWFEGQPTLPRLERFSEVKQFDVKAWAERQKLRDDVEAWMGVTGYYSATANEDWSQFRARFRRQGIELPRYLSDFDRALLTVFYSAKHNRPWGQDQKKLVEVAHRVAGAYKHHLTWFMYAVRKYGRLDSMRAEGDPSKWQRKYDECQAEYRINRAVYAPRREHQAVVEFLFPELVPLP